MKAFEVHAVDYLFEAHRARTLRGRARASEETHRRKDAARPGTRFRRAPSQQYLERLVVRDGTRVTLIPAAKLDYVEAQDDYVALATHGAKHLKQQTIAVWRPVSTPRASFAFTARTS